MAVVVRAVAGRRLSLAIRLVDGNGAPVDTTGRALLFQARDVPRGTVLLSAPLVQAGDSFSATFTDTQTGALSVGHNGVWEIVLYSLSDRSDVKGLASGPFEVAEPIAQVPA